MSNKIELKEESLEVKLRGEIYKLKFPTVGESEDLIGKIAMREVTGEDVYKFFEICGMSKEVVMNLQQNHVTELLAILTGQKKTV
jgi:RNA recognition motif-containing protein